MVDAHPAKTRTLKQKQAAARERRSRRALKAFQAVRDTCPFKCDGQEPLKPKKKSKKKKGGAH